MALSKNLKRKRNSENRIFHDEWTENYAFILPSFINAKPTCLICNEGVSACKEYNIRRHHETKHVTVLEELDTNKSMDDVIGFSTSFAYYGLAMDLQKFGVSIYLMQIIFAAVDFPAKLLALGMLSYLGRRVSQAVCLFLSALIIFANILVPADMQTLRTTLACLGKGFTSASFTTVYLYTGELYPTIIRQTGMGLVSTMARIGSMAAPAVLILDEVLPALPSVVYGGAAVLAGGFACFLPETLNVPLPDTIEDVEEKWSGRSATHQQKEGICLKEGVAFEDDQVVSKDSMTLKELKEAEGTGLNAL